MSVRNDKLASLIASAAFAALVLALVAAPAQAQEILRLKDKLNGILAHHCGKSVDEVESDTDRDNFMSAEDAKDYGLVDSVVAEVSPAETKKGS